MTHKKTLVVYVKAAGKVLRESDDTVTLPFGAEYSIGIKNLDSKRIQVAVSIDGQDAAGRLIINPNSDLELERFIRNGNLTQGNRFRFVERTGAVEQHRGIGASDGIVRVEAWTEIPAPTFVSAIDWGYTPSEPYYPSQPYYPSPRPRRRRNDRFPIIKMGAMASGGITGSDVDRSGTQSANFCSTFGSSTMDWSEPVASLNATMNDAGITVPGSESNQRFHMVSDFPCESQSTVIVLKLRGMLGNQVVRTPMTVEVKPKCVTCGRVNKGTAKFCGQCGTALVIL